MGTLSQLFIYPTKSLCGQALQSAQVTESGLLDDRRFMLTQPDGTFITARTYPQLLLLKTVLSDTGITLISPDKKQITALYTGFSSGLEYTEVWGNEFTSHIASIAVNQWLSDYLAHDVQLRWLGHQSTRRVNKYPQVSLSFADGYPFLLVNQASLEQLQYYCPLPLTVHRFRSNIVVSHFESFAEDGWKRIQIGEVIFDVAKPCSRCVVTTIDPETATLNPTQEPLKTLQQFRSDDNNEIDFGINLIALNTGTLTIGDQVKIVDTRPPKIYRAMSENLHKITCNKKLKKIIIRYGKHVIEGNNQQVLLEQLEAHGIELPYSCRSGFCGMCKVTLVSGTVTPLNERAKQRNQRILSCSCIPNSDIEIK